MENGLHVDGLVAVEIEVHFCTHEFFGQQRNIKSIGIKTGQIAIFDVVMNFARELLEKWCIGDFIVGDPMHIRSTFGDGYPGVDQPSFAFLVAVGQ